MKFPIEPLTQIFETFEAAVSENKFTAWSCANRRYALSTFYAGDFLPDTRGLKEPVAPFHPDFDLASLTKPLFVNTLLRRIIQNSSPDILFAPLREIFEIRNSSGDHLKTGTAGQKRIIDFLDHSAGARPWMWFGKALWAGVKERDAAAFRANGHWPKSTTGELKKNVEPALTSFAVATLSSENVAQVYSDLDYYLLARIFENLTQNSHGTDWNSILAEWNASQKTNYFHASLSPEKSSRAIPWYPYLLFENQDAAASRQFKEFGPVHDTNANILSTLGMSENIVSGHAGLFGSVMDVSRSTRFLAESQNFLSSKAPTGYLKAGKSKRFVFGMDTPSGADSLAGLNSSWQAAQNDIAGHLGYTGTSLWFSEKSLDTNIILTNRTATRKYFGVTSIPRICIVTDLDSGETSNFVVRRGTFEKTADADIYALLQFHYSTTARVWDDAVVRAPSDISNLRKTAGRMLWACV